MDEAKRRNIIPVIAQNTGSLILIAGAVYILKELAVLYGVGVGAAIQSIGTNTPVVPLVASAATQLTALKKIIVPNAVYRIDISDRWIKDYPKLRRWGYA